MIPMEGATRPQELSKLLNKQAASLHMLSVSTHATLVPNTGMLSLANDSPPLHVPIALFHDVTLIPRLLRSFSP